MPTNPGKRWRAELESVPKTPVSVDQAVELVKGFSKTKFDQTVELVCNLGIDPRQADQALRGSVSLPHGIGSTKKVIAFCEGDDVARAKEAGASEAGSDELIAKVQGGWTDFDVAIATPAMMRSVSRLGRVLGPQGKMPSPKSGTVVDDLPTAVREFSAGKIEFRNDSGGNIHAPVGKVSFEAPKLVDNINAFIEHIRRLKPQTARGTYFKKISISATMSPGVMIETPK